MFWIFGWNGVSCFWLGPFDRHIPSLSVGTTPIMSNHGEAVFKDQPYIDPNPLPSSIPSVDELGVSSAPLKSASFFIGGHCKDVNGMASFSLDH